MRKKERMEFAALAETALDAANQLGAKSDRLLAFLRNRGSQDMRLIEAVERQVDATLKLMLYIRARAETSK